jgi:SAM-dependent methyltransferase
LKSISPFILELDTIGSDVENFRCPCCFNHDRLRHLFMYFDKLDFWRRFEGAAILHIAPEAALSERIVSHKPRLYIKGDYSPRAADIQKIDVTAIPFPDESFDVIICNHVLEHVGDDLTALSEMHRVLRPGGCAVLQTPYSNFLARTFTDPAIDSDELRQRYYGQEDHVRLYGRDLFDRFRRAGLTPHIEAHESRLAEFDPVYYGVNPAEDLLLVVRE